jgi:hypothetical protein
MSKGMLQMKTHASGIGVTLSIVSEPPYCKLCEDGGCGRLIEGKTLRFLTMGRYRSHGILAIPDLPASLGIDDSSIPGT